MKHIKLSDSQFETRDGYGRSVLLASDDLKVAAKVQLMRLEPSQTIKPHHHDVRTECFQIVSGNGQIKINGEVVATSSNDIVLCEVGDIHEFINLSQTEAFTFLVIRTNDPGNEDMVWES